MTTLAERIVIVRKLVSKRTQEEFAKTLGLGRASVANWERGGHVTGDNLLRREIRPAAAILRLTAFAITPTHSLSKRYRYWRRRTQGEAICR
jgi:transcriptional regulator with XRE-family HTH domain